MLDEENDLEEEDLKEESTLPAEFCDKEHLNKTAEEVIWDIPNLSLFAQIIESANISQTEG